MAKIPNSLLQSFSYTYTRKPKKYQNVEHLWKELQSKQAPTLLHLLTTIVTFNDHCNISKVGVSHHPGICAAIAVILKERSREMCAIQSIMSVLMYTCHCDKQVARALWLESVKAKTYTWWTKAPIFVSGFL